MLDEKKIDPCEEQDTRREMLPPCAFVLFGATGDLTRRKIVPALFDLQLQGLLPEKFVIVAFARRDKTDESFREDLQAAIKEFAPAAWALVPFNLITELVMTKDAVSVWLAPMAL